MKNLYNTLLILSISFLYYFTFLKTDNNQSINQSRDTKTITIKQAAKIPKLEIYKKNILEKKNISLLKEKSFDLISKEEVVILNNKYDLYSYYLPFIDYYNYKTKPVAYIDHVNEKKIFNIDRDRIILVSGYGETLGLTLPKNNLFDKNSFKNLKKNPSWFRIDNNLKDIANLESLMDSNRYGVKDILVDDKYLYVSIAEIDLKQNDKCKTIKIYRSSLGDSNLGDGGLNFELFFDNAECTNGYNPHAAGGRLIKISENELVLTSGDWLNKERIAQSENSIYGKVINININDPKEYKIVSIGHRNPQGLYFDKDSKIILSTEHGPTGGDEVNLIDLKNNNKKNYGWPLASYGESKDADVSFLQTHSEGNFIEPIMYFKQKYLGISNLTLIDKDFFSKEYYKFKIYILSFLKGSKLVPLIFEKDYRLLNLIKGEKIESKFETNVGTRVRDLIYVSKKNYLVFVGENEPSINFVLKKN